MRLDADGGRFGDAGSAALPGGGGRDAQRVPILEQAPERGWLEELVDRLRVGTPEDVERRKAQAAVMISNARYDSEKDRAKAEERGEPAPAPRRFSEYWGPDRGLVADMGVAAGRGVVGGMELMLRAARLGGAGLDATEEIKALQRFQDRFFPRSFESLNQPMRKALDGGIESAMSSVTTRIPGLALGAVGGPWGAVAGQSLSGGTVYGMAEYDSFIEEARAQGIDPRTVRKEALLSAVAEGGLEGVSNYLDAALMGLTGPAKAGLKRRAVNFVKNYVKVAASEVPTEMTQTASGTGLRQRAGLTEASPWEAAKDVVAPTLVSSLLFTGMGSVHDAGREKHQAPRRAVFGEGADAAPGAAGPEMAADLVKSRADGEGGPSEARLSVPEASGGPAPGEGGASVTEGQAAPAAAESLAPGRMEGEAAPAMAAPGTAGPRTGRASPAEAVPPPLAEPAAEQGAGPLDPLRNGDVPAPAADGLAPAPLRLTRLNGKSFMLYGDTAPFEAAIKAAGGRLDRKAGGWRFPLEREAEIRERFGLPLETEMEAGARAGAETPATQPDRASALSGEREPEKARPVDGRAGPEAPPSPVAETAEEAGVRVDAADAPAFWNEADGEAEGLAGEAVGEGRGKEPGAPPLAVEEAVSPDGGEILAEERRLVRELGNAGYPEQAARDYGTLLRANAEAYESRYGAGAATLLRQVRITDAGDARATEGFFQPENRLAAHFADMPSVQADSARWFGEGKAITVPQGLEGAEYWRTLRNAVKAWSRNVFSAAKPVSNADTGWQVHITPKGIGDTLSHGFDEVLAKSVPFIPQIIESGVYLDSIEKKPGLMSHIFANKIRLDGQDYVVGFVLREDGNGNRFYDHELTEILHPDWLAPGKQRLTVAEHRTNRGDVMNILRERLGVNDGSGRVLFQRGATLSAEAKLREEAAVWEKAVDGIAASGKKPSQPQRMLTQTPLVMHMLGADFRELYLAPHAFDGLFPEQKSNPRHNAHPNITADILKQIPGALADPIAVFGQDNGRLLFMLDVKDANGATVVVPVQFEAKKGFATITLATTVYSKEQNGVPNNAWFERQAKQLRYVNRQKENRWNTSSGANSLWVLSNGFFKKRIFTETDLVKLKNQYPSYYQGDASGPSGGKPSSGPRGAVVFGSTPEGEARALIRLFKGRDFSTVLHEAAHVWTRNLEMIGQGGLVTRPFEERIAALGTLPPDMADMARRTREAARKARPAPALRALAEEARARAEKALHAGETGRAEAAARLASELGRLSRNADGLERARQDVRTLRRYAGVSPEGPLSAEEGRRFYERVASGAEAYFMEGKAPTVRLQRIFDRLRDWLLVIYRSVKGLFGQAEFGGIDLNEEVRAVFDRMLAKKDALARPPLPAGRPPIATPTSLSTVLRL